MIAFGIDPGSRRTGWGVVDAQGSRIHYLEAAVIRVNEKRPLAERIDEIYDGLIEAIAKYEPEYVFVESIFHAKSVKSALVLGHARGVALLAASKQGRDIIEITPAEVKKAVTGSGRAEKSQVQEMVRVLLGLPAKMQEDASDALAIAIAGTSVVRWNKSAGATR